MEKETRRYGKGDETIKKGNSNRSPESDYGQTPWGEKNVVLRGLRLFVTAPTADPQARGLGCFVVPTRFRITHADPRLAIG